jgi:O-methyltransferase
VDATSLDEPITSEALYLDLLKRCLTRYAFREAYEPVRGPPAGLRRLAYDAIRGAVASRGIELVRRTRFDPEARAEGRDWPPEAETMIGLRRLDHLQQCICEVLERDVPGDLIETGTWRGGAAIFMRGVLKAYGVTHRRVWVADSFQGLPKPDANRYPLDAGDSHWTQSHLAVPREQVEANFARYGLLDDQVRFLEGWFADTLPRAPIDRLAVLRLDADMYQSTIEALGALYPMLSVGGYVIVDDYGAVPGCRGAVDDFREEHGITEPIVPIDWTGAFWRRS